MVKSTLLLLNNNIVLFDGVCNLCNTTIDFIIRHDRKKIFYFSSLQSSMAQEILSRLGHHKPLLSSVIFIQNYRIYEQSTAILRIMKNLGFPYSLLYAFIIVPRPLRDMVYKLIAFNRYRWFGKKETCRVPSPEERARFFE